MAMFNAVEISSLLVFDIETFGFFRFQRIEKILALLDGSIFFWDFLSASFRDKLSDFLKLLSVDNLIRFEQINR